MSICILNPNNLCSSCLYLPAVDLIDSAGTRTSAIELNDVCSGCIANCKKIYVSALDHQANPDIVAQLDRLSPWRRSAT